MRRLGLKGDPLNLSVAEAVDFTSDAQEQWQFSAKGKKLADVGHGQVPVGGEDADLVAVSFREVVQQATVSFAALRRIRPAAGLRRAGAAGGLWTGGPRGHFRPVVQPAIRSRATAAGATWSWLGETGERQLEPPGLDAAIGLFRECVARAEKAGLPVGHQWAASPMVLAPAANLASAIRKTWPGN